MGWIQPNCLAVVGNFPVGVAFLFLRISKAPCLAEVGNGLVGVAFLRISKAPVVKGGCVLGIESDCLVVVSDSFIKVAGFMSLVPKFNRVRNTRLRHCFGPSAVLFHLEGSKSTLLGLRRGCCYSCLTFLIRFSHQPLLFGFVRLAFFFSLSRRPNN